MDKMDNFQISSVSMDETTGFATIIVEGYIPVPNGCDNPIVELFRPARLKYNEEMFFTITATADDDRIKCTLCPSNRRARGVEEFLATAKRILKGDDENGGLLSDYKTILEKYFEDEDGLKNYLNLVKKIEKADDFGKIVFCNKANDSIKAFVQKIGLIMPSWKKPKKKKTNAEKRRSSEEYLAKHPDKDKSKKKA